MGNIAFEFDIPNLRGASRPAEYARATDRSEKATQGLREGQLFFFRKQVEQGRDMNRRDVSAQLIQRAQIGEVWSVA